jgi:hypothetical protein
MGIYMGIQGHDYKYVVDEQNRGRRRPLQRLGWCFQAGGGGESTTSTTKHNACGPESLNPFWKVLGIKKLRT